MAEERAAGTDKATLDALAAKIRDVPDFPQPGILFKDITTLLQDGAAFRQALDALEGRCRPYGATRVVGIESRGFIFGAPLADRLGAGFVPARKLGRLPAETVRVEYTLEYGSNTVELHRDAVSPGERVLVVDDLLATGGTALATIKLVEMLGGVVAAVACLVELTFLNGRERLHGYDVEALLAY
jgi:adenine phosphoribosyltransferase